MPSPAVRRGRGRPRKFAEPSRSVTVTLPDSVLEHLRDQHEDLSHAIVQLVQQNRAAPQAPLAALVRFGRRAVISIVPSPALERRVGVDLIPLTDGRALISFEQPRTMADLELTIADALEQRGLTERERMVFKAIRLILKEARQSSEVLLLRRNIIVLEYARRLTPSKSTQAEAG